MSNVTELFGVHPMRPEIAGRSFQDTSGLHPDILSRLIKDEMIFLTEFSRSGKTYGGDIIARSRTHAERIAADRGLGETVIATLLERGDY